MALCLTQWKDWINTVGNCVWQQFFHNFTYILCINSTFAILRPSKSKFIIIYLGKPLVQARTFYVEYSEECGIVNRWIFHAHLLVEHEYAVNIETQARSIFNASIFNVISSICIWH